MATLSSLIQGALGYVAVNKAGDTMTGTLICPGIASGSTSSTTGIHANTIAGSGASSVMVWGKTAASWGGGVHIIGDNTAGTVDGNIRFFRYEGGTTWTQLLQVSKDGGITFPASQLSNADPNTLDDYEEGSWSVSSVVNSDTGAAKTFYNNGSSYVKIGQLVFLKLRIQVLQPGDNIRIYGLPFTSIDTDTNQGLTLATRSAPNFTWCQNSDHIWLQTINNYEFQYGFGMYRTNT